MQTYESKRTLVQRSRIVNEDTHTLNCTMIITDHRFAQKKKKTLFTPRVTLLKMVNLKKNYSFK